MYDDNGEKSMICDPQDFIRDTLKMPGGRPNTGVQKPDDVYVRTGREASPWLRNGMRKIAVWHRENLGITAIYDKLNVVGDW